MAGNLSPVLPPPESLTLAQQVAQMVVVRTSGHLFDHQRGYPAWEADQASLRAYLETTGIGGVILLGGSAAEVGLKARSLQAQSAIPLLIAADIEEGVGQRFAGATQFPPPMALEAIFRQNPALALAYATQMGEITAKEAIAIGLNWMLAPVVDVNNNPHNPVINVRAFGASSEVVSQLSQAFTQGAQAHPILTTAKHFPGHGDTQVDSHLSLPTLTHDWERLYRVELPPFQSAIDAGVDAVMTAHLQVSTIDPQYPATLSPATLTNLLRGQLGFDGLIVTDALIMGGITQRYGAYEAAVAAISAGVDVLLMPADPVGVIEAVCEAVAIGRLSEERILASVERIWRAKQKAAAPLETPPESCHAWEHVPPPPVRLERLAQPESRATAAAILKDAMILQGSLSEAPPQGINLILVDDLLSCPVLERRSPAVTVPERLGYGLQLIDEQGCRRSPSGDLAPTLLQLFIRGNPFRGSAGITETASTWFNALLERDRLLGLLVYGSPYAFETFRQILPANVPFGFIHGQMLEAQEILLHTLSGQSSGIAASTRDFTD
ncbi:beta-glucosidase [filamentous cyanobacterium CCP5]|nr:beta-glucosidase [filamentous cyanobacterium CCP5]